MSEPVSAAASVITLLDAVRAAIGYVNCVRNASRDVQDLFAEFRDFRKELEDYNELMCRTIDGSKPESLSKLPALKRLVEPEDEPSPLPGCIEQIERLNTKLQTVYNTDQSRARRAVHSLLWPVEKKEMLRILGQIKDVGGKLHAALVRDNA